ncbi:protein phosphatase 2C domain-containing protein [Altererythrobacter arenosus]|uniref:Protein phosphatase 2C domain-containing protein n=1 Tax=Altererythrobacter arenosus TaxID=3032592 RepID=A0ABY8FR79_9SPHN|nr:protein phosphatase 2C domain-containing protein [Altererythrobacter sp. CAU 1644]WFL77518.1 protein phosphatase 2C domain-containing protein [Altererythrobacter sp. CAU 1644]
MRFQSASRTDIGLKRKVNEDSLIDRADRSFWVVADGMGGHEAGEVASAMVVESVDEAVTASDLEAALEQVDRALDTANAAMIEHMHGDKRRKMGSTAVGLIIAEDGRYGCFWVGDSRAYRVRDGQIAQITRDHSLVQQLVDAGLISEEDAATHPDASVITRAVGGSDRLEVDHVKGAAQTNDIFILASDGLTRCVEAEEIRHVVMMGNPHQACEDMVEMVLARGAPDNVSVIVVRVA